MNPTDSPTGSAQFPFCTDTVTVNCINRDDYVTPTVPTTTVPVPTTVAAPATVTVVGTVAPDVTTLAHTGPVPYGPYSAAALALVIVGVAMRRWATR